MKTLQGYEYFSLFLKLNKNEGSRIKLSEERYADPQLLILHLFVKRANQIGKGRFVFGHTLIIKI